MKRTALLSIGLLTVTLLALPPAFAATPNALPPEQTQGGVTYRSGGTGQEQAKAFEAAQKQYPLSLEFAVKHTPRAEFASDIHVMIKNARGKTLLDTHSQGPFLLAKLPAGRYTVTAERQGHRLQKRVEVSAHKTTPVQFEWAA